MDDFSTFYEADLHRALMNLIGKNVTLQTTQGSLRGHLHEVMSDYLVIIVEGSPFHVRIAQIIWIFPGL